MEARIRELERAAPREVIDVDAAAENTMVMFSAIEELRKDTEDGWKKLAVPLDLLNYRLLRALSDFPLFVLISIDARTLVYKVSSLVSRRLIISLS